jgi:transposase
MGFRRQTRDEVIRLHIEEGQSTRALAKQFQLGRTTIQNWLRAHRNETNFSILQLKSF